MDSTIYKHHVVEILSNTWWIMNLGLILFLVLILQFTKNKNLETRISIGKFIALFILIDFLFNQFWMYYNGKWSATYSLPLELCSLSVLLGIFVLITKNQFCYELLICWGAGAVHSFLTPEITTGGTLINHIDYFISHGGILLSGIYATTRLGLKPRNKSWLKVFYWTQLTIPIMIPLNYFLNSNYMYLNEKPLVNNPFIIGDWPYYIIGLEFAGLLHFYLFFKFHEWLSKKTF
ncbi:MAG: TIGR02206 family membrane protein [Bacteroidetes bacterium]|nr:TIGR02206 family membrane protein [Bacteroidota bacterium]